MHGNVVHLFERDCSVQRRHQKVIEESPATGLSENLREQLQSQALLATRTINYVGAGTIEFLVADGRSFFLEMNTRLQVEHPVTEMLTGVDLVEWQLMVAAGNPIPIEQKDISRRGHAIEVRVYAEDPDAGFLPASGRVTCLDLPVENKNLRIDTGIEAADEVSVYYDPLMLKLITHGATRENAINTLENALRDSYIEGVKTNLPYLIRVLSHPSYITGKFDTGFLDTNTAALTVSNEPADEEMLGLACLYLLLERKREAAIIRHPERQDPNSPWRHLLTWRLNHHANEKMILRNAGVDRTLSVRHSGTHEYLLNNTTTLPGTTLPGTTLPGLTLSGSLTDTGRLTAQLDNRPVTVTITLTANGFIVNSATELHAFSEVSVDDAHGENLGQQGHLRSPMPGTIVSIDVCLGDQVKTGQTLLILEAMKMEHTITAPADGVVSEMLYQAGDRVDADVELLVIEPAHES